jgi:hypothetical protein
MTRRAHVPMSDAEGSTDPTAPRKERGSTTRCVYFPDRELLTRLSKALNNHPRASLSSIIVQILDQAIPVIENLPLDQHKVEVPVSLWL